MNPTQIQVFKQKALQYAASFEVCSYLDSHHYSDKYGKHDCLIAFGVKEELFASVGQAFSALKIFVEQHQDWMFGLLSYDLKNEVEVLEDPKTDLLNFPDLYFFVPQYLISIKDSQISVLKGEQTVVDEILQLKIAEESLAAPVNIKNRLSKHAYLDKLESIKQHIKRGDVYEMNFCQEFCLS